MNYKKAKQKWFDECLLDYEIFFYGAVEYGNNFTLIEYAQDAPSYAYRHNNIDAKLLTEYFENMNPYDRFFEARRVELKHKKENKKSHIRVYFNTKKAKAKELKKLI